MGRRLGVALGAVVIACLAVSPAVAQRKTHGAGVSWSGSHGGVSWDGGHAYEGGSYGGYPAASPPRPAYKAPQISPSRAAPSAAQRERRDERRAMRRPVHRGSD